MNKQYTEYIKGVAILLMVALHLFKHPDLTESLGCMIWVGNTPLLDYFVRACNPVPFFLILSGYGLTASFRVGGGKKNIIRVLKLYLHLWIIYLIFVPIASYVKPELYPGGWVTFFKNATSWQCSYIGEQWFFLPYILLMLASQWLIPLFDKMKEWLVLGIGCIVYLGTAFVMKRYGESTLDNNMLFFNVFLALYMLLPFAFGYLAKRNEWMGKFCNLLIRKRMHSNWVVLLGLLLLMALRCMTSHRVVDPFYSIAFVVIFSSLNVGAVLGKFLSFFGKYSMNIWLIHTWICVRLFEDFTYNLHYPVLMYLFVLGVSLVSSICVESIYNIVGQPVVNMVKKKLKM